MMNKKRLTRIFTISAAGILAVLVLIAFLLSDNRAEEAFAGPVIVSVTEEPEAALVALAPATPSPAPTPALPEGACTLLVNQRPVFTLSSEEEMEALIEEYLMLSAAAPEGERFVSVDVADELLLVPGVDGLALSAYDEAMALLNGEQPILRLRVVTERITEAVSPVETTLSDDNALPKGSRIIVQYGVAGYTASATQRCYVAGELVEESAPEEIDRMEGRALLVCLGTWTSQNDTPARNEGPKGKSAGELKLTSPMRGNISSFFGMRDGNMHSGLDITASAGTAIVSPGEGLVVYAGLRGAYGYVVDIDHGNGFVSRLTHIDPASVQIEYNQRVFPGEQIGTLAAADAGKPHLHYELIIDAVPYNPQHYMQ